MGTLEQFEKLTILGGHTDLLTKAGIAAGRAAGRRQRRPVS
jgi:hypothetical protein